MQIRDFFEVKSKLNHLGLNRFIFWGNTDGLFTTPASATLYVGYVLEGSAYYHGKKVSAGDVFSFGLNTQPLWGKSYGLSIFLIDINFSLFYQLTGLTPVCCKDILILYPPDPFFRLSQILSGIPFRQWIPRIEQFVLDMLAHCDNPFNIQTERLIYMTKSILQGQFNDFDTLSRKVGISYRAMQRDFSQILGISPKQYINIHRLYQAAEHIKNKELAESAYLAGYFDQSHMTREFKKMSGLTPAQVSLTHRKNSRMFLSTGAESPEHNTYVVPY